MNARLLALAAAVALTGCTSMLPDRRTATTIELPPGETLEGRFTVPGGERTLVAFVSPGHRDVHIAFIGDPLMGEPSPLGYAHQWIEADGECHVTLTNVGLADAALTCHVTGPGDVRISLTPLPPPVPADSTAILDPVLH